MKKRFKDLDRETQELLAELAIFLRFKYKPGKPDLNVDDIGYIIADILTTIGSRHKLKGASVEVVRDRIIDLTIGNENKEEK
jgi:hypothetical protein